MRHLTRNAEMQQQSSNQSVVVSGPVLPVTPLTEELCGEPSMENEVGNIGLEEPGDSTEADMHTPGEAAPPVRRSARAVKP